MTKKKSLLIYSSVFLAVFVTAFFAFFAEGKSFVWKSDGFRQYYPTLQYLGEYYRTIVSNIFSGNFSLPMMDYTIGQGEDIITTFANYGLGDPLTLLSAFVTSKKGMEVLYGVLIFLRLYLSGIAFLLYGEQMNLSRRPLIFGALVYVFSGYALWSIKDPFFLNAMIYLPLVLLGIERVMKKNSPLPLVLSVFFCLCSGYYFFYMIVLAAVAYFVARQWMKCGRIGREELGQMLRDGVRCLVAAFGGVLLSSVLFVPCVYGFLQSTRTESYVSIKSLLVYEWTYYRDMVLRFATMTSEDNSDAVWFFSMAAIVLIALFVLFQKKGDRYRPMKISVVLCVLAVASPLVGYVFNGLGYITNRFMFIPAFLLALVLTRMIPDLLALEKKEKQRVATGCGIYVILCIVFSWKNGMVQVAGMTAMLLATLAILCIVKDKKWKEYGIYTLIVLNLAINGNMIYAPWGVGLTGEYINAGKVAKTYTNKTIQKATELAGELDRIDDMTDKGENPNRSVVSYNGEYSGTSVYYSVINSRYAEYMMSLEMAPDLMYPHRILGYDGRTVMENLANVKYVVSDNEDIVPYGFEKCDKNLYVNTNQTSIGYTYDTYISEAKYEEGNVYERQGTLLQTAVLEEESELLQKVERAGTIPKGTISGQWTALPFEMTGVKKFKWDGETAKVKKRGRFTIELRRKPGYEYYLRLSDLEIQKSEENTLWGNVRVGDLLKKFVVSDTSYDFHIGRQDYLISLGSVSEEATETLLFRINGPATYRLGDIELVEVPMETLGEQMNALTQESLQNVKVSGNTLVGELTVTADKILCLAVPYKDGYTLLVDGKETTIGEVNNIYVGAQIPVGEHDILLTYNTPGLAIGATLSLLGIIYIVILLAFWRKCNNIL
nr:YfhO family protein [Eubacterium sp.]